jgi:hypothetical protein
MPVSGSPLRGENPKTSMTTAQSSGDRKSESRVDPTSGLRPVRARPPAQHVVHRHESLHVTVGMLVPLHVAVQASLPHWRSAPAQAVEPHVRPQDAFAQVTMVSVHTAVPPEQLTVHA